MNYMQLLYFFFLAIPSCTASMERFKKALLSKEQKEDLSYDQEIGLALIKSNYNLWLDITNADERSTFKITIDNDFTKFLVRLFTPKTTYTN